MVMGRRKSSPLFVDEHNLLGRQSGACPRVFEIEREGGRPKEASARPAAPS